MHIGLVLFLTHSFQKNVFYLFYEGNDLRDMMFEEKTFLKKYLEKSFSQNLFKSNKDKVKFLNDYENVFYEILPLKIEGEKQSKNHGQCHV